MQDISGDDIERFKAFLLKTGPNKVPLSRTTVNEILKHLQSIFTLGLSKGWYTGSNPVKGVQRYKVTKKKRNRSDFLSKEEVDRLLEAANAYSQQMHWLFLLCIFAGLRKNEVVNTRWEWLDFRAKKIKLSEHDGFQLKDAEERIIPMSKHIKDAMQPHAKSEGFVFESGRKSEGKWRYRWDPDRSFATIVASANVPRATFQLLRITFGSLLVQQNVSIYKVAEWMGHSKVTTTQKYYAGLEESDEDIDRI
jgi:integrase